ncbi:hypothetical protein [Streptomyces sp. NBC_00316]|uniref:hypothetical protein n=1 Tax=Streptomyces sp. NBC_00316 TaxID=2975710 RepID=UPI002E2C505F|nr:hypothetical protein [Streptomyces sp. NBC_00316]
MRKSRIAVTLGGAVAATVLTISTASAITLEVDVAGTTPWPGGAVTARCASTEEAVGCFRSDGDWFSLVDQKSDGHSVVIRWATYDPKSNVMQREGIIWNTAGLNAYRYMNKNLAEGDFLEFSMCAAEWSTKHIIENTCAGTTSATA